MLTVMKLFEKILGRRQPIDSREQLAEFIDTRAAFLTQKGIYEYSRARAGHYAKVLFSEPGFRDSVEHSRWSAFPLALGMVAETVDVLLRPHAGDRRRAMLDELTLVTLAVFDRYPVPPSIGADGWQAMREALVKRLNLVGGHAPKRVMDIPDPLAETYFSLMPIHEKLRGRDFATTRNYLRVSLCNIHDELAQRIDAPAVTNMLLSRT